LIDVLVPDLLTGGRKISWGAKERAIQTKGGSRRVEALGSGVAEATLPGVAGGAGEGELLALKKGFSRVERD
jgi:hypothetical protein